MMLKRTMILMIALMVALMPCASIFLCACADDCFHCNEEQAACHSSTMNTEASTPSCCSPSAENISTETDQSADQAPRVIDTHCACSHSTASESVALLPSTSRKTPVPILVAVTSPSVIFSRPEVIIRNGPDSFAAYASQTHLFHCVFLC
ncbi:MAG: hypothetical protein GX130_04795 [Candidatus Hydrogenedens sp.]|nr:hypothetical protein [Candidatus Hydrogenedens sp.]